MIIGIEAERAPPPASVFDHAAASHAIASDERRPPLTPFCDITFCRDKVEVL
jgi:hypothetical protein